MMMKAPFYIWDNLSLEEFVHEMLAFGKPVETSLVGVFDEKGRGSRTEQDLPMHRDGEYSGAKTGEYKKVDIIGLYCLKEGETTTIVQHGNEEPMEFKLEKGSALVIDNNVCTHGRKGKVGDRLLFRIWIETDGEKNNG